jgi:dTDP-4-amino-4,6-dideoxygalactose transaminase
LCSGKVNYWTGEETQKFEREFAKACGCRYGVALANGTVSLELALHSLEIGEGDEVVLAPRTFVASASSVVLRGARPVFADVDPVSQNFTVDTIRAVLSPRTKAVIAVHLAGWPCEIEAIRKLCNDHQLKLIEDCAQAHGATYKGQPVGSFGDAAAFSFCQDKIMTTGGEGGMLVTNDEDVWKKAFAYKDHGKSHDAVRKQKHGPGFRWLHESFGTNWRMTEMQAAIGRVQLGKLPNWLDRRRRNAAFLNAQFREVPALRTTEPPDHIGHAYYKYYVFLLPDQLRPGWDRDRILKQVSNAGVQIFSGCCPEVYLEKAFLSNGLRPAGRLPIAKELGETSLMFLVHPTSTDDDMERTLLAVEGVFQVASR